ncbi:ABC transporter permease [Runella sp. SP2]|uniref:ABC transporter permease n=1 Tax=Runella sp. SP2 TaxID=2268026 RepID=UPI000F083832|nr:ABC transporter permease [Runella sp. SP2]AYQ32757.1 ABC transporter permease [Runella sp. SP2]
MKIVLSFVATLLTLNVAFAQAALELTEDKPSALNGIEFSYTIRNERTEETYSRYEVSVVAQNKSGCMLIYFKKEGDNLNSIFEGDPSAIARFECTNATGKRLTSKGANVKAKAFYVPYTQNGTTTKVEGGYLLKNGSRVSTDLIVIVPKGERPKFKVRPQDFAELTD